MASKKYLFILSLATLLAADVFAQSSSGSGLTRGAGYDVTDSSLIPRGRRDQQSQFLNKQYDFPAKPKNMWELGINAGMFTVSGDVKANTLPGYGFGATIRKALGYVVSLRGQFVHGIATGLNYEAAQNYGKNSALNGAIVNYYDRKGTKQTVTNPNYATQVVPYQPIANVGPVVYYNYKTWVNELALEMLVNFNNIKFHRDRNKVSMYGGFGIGWQNYNTFTNYLNDKALYDFSKISLTVSGDQVKNAKTIRKDLKAMMDKTYETPAERHTDEQRFMNRIFNPMATALVGMQFRLGKRVSLGLEQKWTYLNDDLLDGQRWQEHAWGDAVLTRDFDTYGYTSLSLNFNLGGKSTEPLWWVNPMDYAYQKINTPIKPLKADCATDTDGDGVPDCYDKEANSEKDCPVDSHGVLRDTDGDGVPDCKDKQLITPTECQPSDADGVGKCPDPACCTKVGPKGDCNCSSLNVGTISFPAGATKISPEMMASLSALSAAMKTEDAMKNNCKAVITGFSDESKRGQQISWDRVNRLIEYMSEKQGISRDRFIFRSGMPGSPNAVEIRAAAQGEDGPSNVTPPFPGMKK